jgi:hypothetical protein
MSRFAALAATAAAFVLLGADAPDPLAPARAGSLQCYTPRPAQKTCRAIARYTFSSDGTIVNEAAVLLSPDNFLVMKTVSPVEIRGNAVCGLLRKDDIKTAAIYMYGRKLEMDDANMVRVQVQLSLATRLGKEVCTTYEPYQDEFYARAAIDGVVDSLDYVRWVKPDEGYTVAP